MQCNSCFDRECERAEFQKLKLCRNGVPYIRQAHDVVDRLEEPMPLRSLADNLRHELHQFLQLIVVNACEIDSSVTAAELDPKSPASRIVAATVLINNFVEIIAGVHNFDPPKNAFKGSSSEPLKHYFSRAIASYALLENAHRCENLRFKNDIDVSLRVAAAPKAFEYIAFILIDNCYKYALDGTKVTIESTREPDDSVTVKIGNYSNFSMSVDRVFERGYQENKKSAGYGYGLFWTRRLVAYINEQLSSNLSITVAMRAGSPIASSQYIFEIKGIPCG